MLEIKNLNYSTQDSAKIISDCNITFSKGINVITGPNGSGKSTFAKILMGIEKQQSGQIVLNNTDISELTISERANMGMTLAFQQPIKFKGITVREMLNFANKKNNSTSQACSLLSQVGLCAREYVTRIVDDTLSGGELKRIELAIALAKGGDVIIFDEPEAGIDMWSFDAMINIFKNLRDKIVIIISHNQKIIDIADNIFLFQKNKAPKILTKDEFCAANKTTICSGKRSAYEQY